MKKLLLLFLCFITLSCCSQKNNSEPTAVETTLIAKGELHGNGEEGINEANFVISDEATWNDLMAKMNSVNMVSKQFSETSIDFSKHRIIAVFDEVRTSGGHSINVELTPETDRIVARVTKHTSNGYASTVITQPYYIIKISNTKLPIVFE